MNAVRVTSLGFTAINLASRGDFLRTALERLYDVLACLSPRKGSL